MLTPNYISRKAASEYLLSQWGLKRSPNYLAKLACVGGGPSFHKAGRDPLYPKSGLDAWALATLGPLVRSTAEARTAA